MTETAPIQNNPAAGLPRTEGRRREVSWFEAMADAWGQALDRQANNIRDQSLAIGDGDDSVLAVNTLQAEAQRMNFLSNASHTAITTVGSSLDTIARKQ